MKLNRQEIIEIVGVIAVVLSLIFVGVQLILDRRVAVADQYHARAESRMTTMRTRLESEAAISELVHRWNTNWRPNWWNETLESEFAVFPPEVTISRFIQVEIAREAFDNLFFQYKQGLYPADEWQQDVGAMKRMLEQPIYRAIFPASRGLEWKELVNGLIAEIEADS